MPVLHNLTATTPDEKRIRQREANRRSYYKHLESRRLYYRQRTAARRLADPDAYNAYQREMQTKYRRRDGVTEKARNTPEQAKAKRAAEYARWAKNNPARPAAIVAHRRAMKRKATPTWADKRAISVFYEIAARVSKCLGISFEVDHYFPLKGKTVSGLHCEQNLRVIPAVINMRKGNKCPQVFFTH